jgi:hypothetical protein
VTLVLVSREALAELLVETYKVMGEYAAKADRSAMWEEELRFLYPESPLVTLAVEAGLPVPGPLVPGTVPPPPPTKHYDAGVVHELLEKHYSAHQGTTASTYRTGNDPRLRCSDDSKVVYTSMEHAEHAAGKISERQPMRAYLGQCGHYHVSRRK